MHDLRPIIVLLGILALVAVGAVMYLLQSILLPFVIAVFLSFLFKPVVEGLRKRRIPTFVALIIVILVVAAVLAGLSMVVVGSVNAFIDAIPRYEGRMTALVQEVTRIVERAAEALGLDPGSVRLSDAVSVGSVTSVLSSSLGSLISTLGNGFLILLFMIFILAGAGDFSRKIRRAFPSPGADHASEVIESIDDRVRKYMFAKMLISLLTGTVTAVILVILGVDFALLWGFLAFLLNFIPNFGSLIATVFPVLIALLQFEGPGRAVLAFILLVVAQNAIGNFLEPKLMAFRFQLSPLLILVSLIFWGWLWGVWGMILAVPIMSTFKIVCEQVNVLKPVAVLMSGPPPKEKTESWEGG
ncbi:MAG: AI-2E family transporter [Bacteroidota bacterium]|nr:AI-2E family transporter [Bacteroidota bacterium]